MKQRLQLLLVSVLTVLGLSMATLAPAQAINVFDRGCAGNGNTAVCNAKGQDTAGALTRNIISLLLFLIGVLAVIMIIVGGIRYVVSNGDSAKVKSAKDTVLYAIVGLVVAMLAYAIVNFVVGRF